MCPDRQVLSVYLDGELLSPWKEKLEDHLAQCPQCRERLESYRRVSTPAGVDMARMEVIKERIWQNLEAREQFRRNTGGVHNLGSRSGVFTGKLPVWRRRISIPLPAAAALVIALAALWIRRPAEQPVIIPQLAIASEQAFDGVDAIPVSDMDGVFQYLGSRDTGDMLILQLPESRNFVSSGEPAILKAADYSRRRP